MGEYNRVAVLLQGLLDRSAVLHPHPKVRLWDVEDFDKFIVLSFDRDRAITSGPPPNFEAYRAGLEKGIQVGSFTINQERVWWNRERERHNRNEAPRYRYSDRDRTIYEDNNWWWPDDDDPGPGYIAAVTRIRGGQASFKWERRGKRQRAGAEPWDGDYPTVKDSIRSDVGILFNVSAYQPGDFKRFFDDPRTREQYLKWAPILLAAEEWHAQGGDYQPPIKWRP